MNRFTSVNASKFRIINFFAATLFLIWEVRRILFLIIEEQDETGEAVPKHPKAKSRRSTEVLNHAAFNICVFPPLFFFYGLYYTDVISAISVLVTYRFYLKGANKSLVIAGIASLFFRQTNIFWVSVFLGGLEINRSLATGHSGVEFPIKPKLTDVVVGSLQYTCVYDPLVSEARFEGLRLRQLAAVVCC